MENVASLDHLPREWQPVFTHASGAPPEGGSYTTEDVRASDVVVSPGLIFFRRESDMI